MINKLLNSFQFFLIFFLIINSFLFASNSHHKYLSNSYYCLMDNNTLIKPDTNDRQITIPKNSVYVEYVPFISLNYERVIISKNNNNLSLILGYSYYKDNFIEGSYANFAINYQHIFNKKAQYEIGLCYRYGKEDKYRLNRTSYNYYVIVNAGIRRIIVKGLYFQLNINLSFPGNERIEITPFSVLMYTMSQIPSICLGITF